MTARHLQNALFVFVCGMLFASALMWACAWSLMPTR